MEKQYNWINSNIKIDFPLPSIIQDIVDELESLDQAKDDVYFDRIAFLENFTKKFITRTLWIGG